MRPIALLPVACAVVALVLSMLTLFAGSKTTFMQNYDMLTVRSFQTPSKKPVG
jgi:hypothetical protein